VTLLYFADTRFPIERANGLQTMATCHALAARGHDVTLVVRPDTTDPARDPVAFYDLPLEPRLRIVSVPARGGARAKRARYMLQAAAMAARTDALVYTRDLGLASFLLQFPRVRRPRVIYESHGIAPIVAAEMPGLLGSGLAPSPSKLARLDTRERRVWHHAAAYVTITKALADELSTRYGSRTGVHVVPDGARVSSTPDLAVQHPVSSGLVGYAGHLYPWKGVDVLIHAIARSPHLRGLIVGGHPKEPDLARVHALAVSLHVADRIEFTGLLPPAGVMAQLLRASVLVLPNTASAISERYTSPLKLFEYLSAGRPIVASDLPAFREVLTHGDTALLVPPGDASALAAALERVTADASLASGLATRAHGLAANFTWSARAERLEATLRDAQS
jgi:glycosyltransferase involved in cell wall biosynthesis